MNREFISYEHALALRELGFDEPCCAYYGLKNKKLYECNFRDNIAKDIVSAPLFQQAFRWLREKCGLSSEIHLKMSNNKRKIWYNINELDNRLVKSMYFKNYPKGFFKTFEEAELECLNNLIEVVKRKL